MKISALTPDLFPAAARMLSLQHQKPEDLLLSALRGFDRPGMSGVVAHEGDQLLGFLLGQASMHPFYGRSVRVPLLGQAVSSEHPDLLANLYAALGEQWLLKGNFLHQVMVPVAHTQTQQAWFRLGFGVEQVHGELDLTDLQGKLSPQVRRATLADLDQLADLVAVIGRHYVHAPVFEPFYPEQPADLLEGYAEVLQETDWTLWLYEEERQVLAFQLHAPLKATWEVPEHTAELKTAATLPAARGRGLQKTLLRHALLDLKVHGVQQLRADWRGTNLQSARAWRGLGFQETVFRLSRRLPADLGWARGAAE
ncbi:GNAT family N-acetyltransferase [Deinococcus cellulosilyticus]|uniref:N-acetyltransferase domain-containing protein n=1 Tax=Deinococcus cellulosilyticus (strain DSM 18568 / NBRC 106333 / KACC 11606 / 5516J-15) TaxID=1223518 RepID=A0A511N9T9_DEIC1|nr:GNAT family N-acetyltransferase [Deinococcus cellulosilyticus]GEM49592.1 hypothetical protein DC3_52270 [Deinococcus cellulosilyticus NBRC 106333 = KACC 11606]